MADLKIRAVLFQEEVGDRQTEKLGKEIPYDTVFVGEPRSLTPEELAWAHAAIDEYLEQKDSDVSDRTTAPSAKPGN